ADGDAQGNVVHRPQAAELLDNVFDLDGVRAHDDFLIASLLPMARTMPCGANSTTATYRMPNMVIQRSVWLLTECPRYTTRKAPRMGPSKVPAPPMMTISMTSADMTMPTASGLTKPL